MDTHGCHPAATPPSFARRTLGLFCSNNLSPGGLPQLWGEAKPDTPSFSRDCFRSGHVTQIWPSGVRGNLLVEGVLLGNAFSASSYSLLLDSRET